MPSTLRVLTINVHKGLSAFNRRFVLHELKQAIREAHPEIVLLQEVISGHRHRAKKFSRWPQENHYEFLADRNWPHFAYGKNSVYPAGDHGNAILSKYPIAKRRCLDISTPHGERRGLLHTEIELPGSDKRLHCLCTHLSLVPVRRRKQFKKLVDYIRDEVPSNASYILGGDFNDWALEGHRYLRTVAGLSEVIAGTTDNVAKTFPAVFPVLRLDRIYYKNLTSNKSNVCSEKPWSVLSDHCALLAEIELPA